MSIWDLLKSTVIIKEHFYFRMVRNKQTKLNAFLHPRWFAAKKKLNQEGLSPLQSFSFLQQRESKWWACPCSLFSNPSSLGLYQTARYWERFPSPKALWTFQMGRGPSRLNAPSSWHEFLFSRENNGICVARLSNPSTQDLRIARASPASR